MPFFVERAAEKVIGFAFANGLLKLMATIQRFDIKV